MTINNEIERTEKPRFTFDKNDSSTSVNAIFRGVNLSFNLRKRPGSPNYQVFKKIKGKQIPKSTGVANLELAAEKGAEIFSKILDIPWTDSAKDVVVTERKNWSSIQDAIDAFEAAAAAKKIITKKNKPLGKKSVRDYPAAIRLAFGFGNDQSIKGIPTSVTEALKKIPLSALGEKVDGNKCAVLEDYRRRVLSDGAGDILTCGPTYEKKANTFNSMLLKCKALFSPNVVEVAYGDLVLPDAAIETFRATKKCGVDTNKCYEAPPAEVVEEIDEKVIAIRDNTDFSKSDSKTDSIWNHIIKYFIARLSGLRKDEINHLSFGSFKIKNKVARDPITNQISKVSVPVVIVTTTDVYNAWNGVFKQAAWECKGKSSRSVQIPRWLHDFIKTEQKRRKADSSERIFRGQERWTVSTLDKLHDDWWNDELLYGTDASDYFKKRLHELRALFGSEVVTNTGSMHAAQLALGHQNISTTEKYYANLLVDYNFSLNIGA